MHLPAVLVDGRSDYRIGPHQTVLEFHSLLQRNKSNCIGHSQYHIGPPK